MLSGNVNGTRVALPVSTTVVAVYLGLACHASNGYATQQLAGVVNGSEASQFG